MRPLIHILHQLPIIRIICHLPDHHTLHTHRHCILPFITDTNRIIIRDELASDIIPNIWSYGALIEFLLLVRLSPGMCPQISKSKNDQHIGLGQG